MIRSRWRSGNGVPADSTGRNSDLYLAVDSGDIYEKDTDSWNYVGLTIAGTPGPAGATGAAGPAGAAGATGAAGAAGPSNLITESAGPTALTVGAIADTDLLTRVGSTVVGLARSFFALASHTHLFADLTGAAATVHTHTDADITSTQRTRMAADMTLASGANTLTFASALNVTTGRIYEYTINLFVVNSAGTPTITLGTFTVAGGASASAHNKSYSRFFNNTYGSDALVDASLTATGIGTTTAAGDWMFRVTGTFTCNGSGTITPLVTTNNTGLAAIKMSTFELRDIT